MMTPGHRLAELAWSLMDRPRHRGGIRQWIRPGHYTAKRRGNRRGAGKIISVGSEVGHRGLPGSSAYVCSKAGLCILTRLPAQELWRFHISVNELIAGPVITEMSRDTQDESRESAFAIDSAGIKSPEDVVPPALILATQPDVGPTAQSIGLM